MLRRWNISAFPDWADFTLLERSKGLACREEERGFRFFLSGQKKNARTQGAFFGSATFIRCRTTHTRTPCAAASKAPTAHGRAPTVAPRSEMRRSVSHREHRRRAHGHTRTRVVSCISPVASTRVPRRNRSRNRERVTALFDSRLAWARGVENG